MLTALHTAQNPADFFTQLHNRRRVLNNEPYKYMEFQRKNTIERC